MAGWWTEFFPMDGCGEDAMGKDIIKVPSLRGGPGSCCGRDLRSITKADRAGVWVSLFLTGGC